MLSITDTIQIPLDEFEFSFARSGGPGGQNVNKVNSKAVMRWRVLTSTFISDEVRSRFIARYKNRLTVECELVISSQQHRDQAGNVQDCLDKVREMLISVATRPIPRRPTRPTLGSKRRRVDDKRVNSKKKQQRQSPDME